jgi:glycosyltransferase involved in cell wall biosynthesis
MLTSRQEGLPLSLLEAASMGRALAAPDLGSCGDVVRNGVTGVLFDPGSTPAEIATQLEAVLDGPTLRAMGEASRQVYLDRYGIERWVDAVEEVYRDAAGAAERG